MSSIGPSPCDCAWIRWHTNIFGGKSCAATPGGVNHAAPCRTWKSITRNFAATPATTPKRTSSRCATLAIHPFTTTRSGNRLQPELRPRNSSFCLGIIEWCIGINSPIYQSD